MEAILVLFGMLLLAVPVVAFIGIAHWILGPVDRAAELRGARARLTLADFFCLFLAVQLPLAFVYQVRDEETKIQFWVLTVITWVVAPFVWFACARALSRAGISNSVHRFIFMGIVLPIVYYGLLPFVVMAGAGAVIVVTEGPMPLVHSWRIGAVWLGLAAGIALSGLFTPWMVRCATAQNEGANDSDAFAD